MLDQFYVDFNKLFEEVKEIFSIIADMKEMQERWNKLMVLIFLRALRSEFSKDQPNVIGSFTIKSRIPTTSYVKLFLRSHRIQNPAIREPRIIMLLQSKAKQQKIEIVGVILEIYAVMVVVQGDEQKR